MEREQRREARKKEKEIGRKRKNKKNEGTRIICSFLHILIFVLSNTFRNKNGFSKEAALLQKS